MKKLNAEESLEWIKTRRSVFPKEFEDEIVGLEEVRSLLEAARYAPTHKYTEPWRFQVFSGESKKALIETQVAAWKQAHGEDANLAQKTEKFRLIGSKASVIIAIVMHRDEAERLPEDEELWATACAVQNMHLHAKAFDIGGYWSTGASTNLPEIRQLLKLGTKDRHMGWFYLGRYTKDKSLIKERRSVEEMTTWKS